MFSTARARACTSSRLLPPSPTPRPSLQHMQGSDQPPASRAACEITAGAGASAGLRSACSTGSLRRAQGVRLSPGLPSSQVEPGPPQPSKPMWSAASPASRLPLSLAAWLWSQPLTLTKHPAPQALCTRCRVPSPPAPREPHDSLLRSLLRGHREAVLSPGKGRVLLHKGVGACPRANGLKE